MQHQYSSSEIGDMVLKTIHSYLIEHNNTQILVLKRDSKEMMISSTLAKEVESWLQEVLLYILSLETATIRSS